MTTGDLKESYLLIITNRFCNVFLNEVYESEQIIIILPSRTKIVSLVAVNNLTNQIRQAG